MMRFAISSLLISSLMACTSAALLERPSTASHVRASPPRVTPDFSLSRIPIPAPATLQQAHPYSLPELIGLAQQANPLTRIAWLEAEQAALATGMVKATYLPMLSASAIGGYQHRKYRTRNELDTVFGEIGFNTRADTHIKGVVPALTLEWLLFDFGKRAAVHEAAQELALASQIKFSAVHQAVIFNVTRTFFDYNASRENARLSDEHLTNAQALTTAAQARFAKGVATSIEVAQASQLAAQAKLMAVQTQSLERDAYQALLSAVGLPPTSELQIADAQSRTLPDLADLPDNALLQQALAYRPDLLAVDAARRAAEFGIQSAKANYMPKVALLGIAASGNADFDVRGIGSISPHTSSQAILLGVTVPIFDGGLRRMRLYEAQAQAEAAQELVRKTQQDALQEMRFAANALRTALEAFAAASELVAAATLTFDAASEAYQVGVGNMMLATEAANGLLDATQAKNLAYSGALVASANLAFMMGQLNQAPDAQNVELGLPAAAGYEVSLSR